MEIHLTQAQEARLSEIAAASGRGTDELMQEAVDRLLAYNDWFREQVQIGLDQIERGEFVEHEEVRSRMERMFPPG